MTAPENSQTQTTADAYGDESIKGDFAVYALVIVPTSITELANEVLAEVKKEYGIDSSERIHCSEIYNPVGRARTCWEKLKTPEILRSWKKIGSRLSALGVESRVGYVDRRRFLSRQKFGAVFSGAPVHDKILARIAFGCCCADLEKTFGVSRMRFWLDPEKTKVHWGEKSVKSMDIPICLEGEQLLSKAITSSKPAILDVADILAYTAMRTLNYPSDGIINAKRVYKSFKASERSFEFVEQVFKEKS